MINSNKWMERFLQERRFNKVIKYINRGTILDFGGNEGELLAYLSKNSSSAIDYTVCNYDYKKIIKNNVYDNIIMLAVIEHMEKDVAINVVRELSSHLEKYGIFFITTPSVMSHPILDIMSRVHLTDRANILEHKHYWNKKELYELAEKLKLKVLMFKRFQFGLNQLFIMRKEQ